MYHKDPTAPPTSIDLIRLRSIAKGLIVRGIGAEIIAPVREESMIRGIIPVRPLSALAGLGRYHIVKTSYHFSIELINGYEGPVVSRIVRVVDEKLPERDKRERQRLLRCQAAIRERAHTLVLNNSVNEERWRRIYGQHPPIVQIPNGCPDEIPLCRKNPFRKREKVVLFLGSIAAPRMLEMLNKLANGLVDRARVHVVGLDKTHLYGGDKETMLDSRIVYHGEKTEEETWQYIQHARVGLALATGPHPFDNDITKIFYYLRGGLPVVSEQGVLNNSLIRETGFGTIFAFGDTDDLVAKTIRLLQDPQPTNKQDIMGFMARKHSWSRRVEAYMDLFERIGEE